MKKIEIQIYSGLISMLIFLVISVYTNNHASNHFFAALAIIAGVYNYRLLSKKDRISKETHANLRPVGRILHRRKNRIRVARKTLSYGNVCEY
ncbi:hypothetical protein AAKU52_000590 [Pedobacter sp. CG_S7]|uniref:hypothetical protein n=1 Tax=Pedobacter sp. CG_S7 TaxID=3143930 RepID=UPI0033987C17